MCVDDEPLVLEVIKKFFEREPGFSVKTCTTGKDALNLLDECEFDAILADYSLPDLDGIQLLMDVRRRGIAAIFIIITGKHRAQIAIDALNNGADYYVQKGGGVVQDIPYLARFIRAEVDKARAARALQESERAYRSLIEYHSDLLCRFAPNGELNFVNTAFTEFAGRNYSDCINDNFFSLVSDEDSAKIQSILCNLTPSKPVVLIEHRVKRGDGGSALLQWNYRSIFNQEGAIIEFQGAGRAVSDIMRLSENLQSDGGGASAPPPPAPHPGDEEMADDWGEIEKTINSLQEPVFAIDTSGVVIAWNNAMEQLTGIGAKTMLGKGNHEYSVPFYGETRPMLADFIVMSDEKNRPLKLPGIKQTGNAYIGEMEKVTIRGRPMFLWARAAALHDQDGRLIAVIETITVVERAGGTTTGDTPDEEIYLGGISSPTLKVTSESLRGAGAGVTSSSGKGYGLYATSRRLFVIQNPDFDLSKPRGIQYEPFGLDDLFGTRATIDSRPRTIESIEKLKIYEIPREDLRSIELMIPRLLPGFLTLYSRTGESFRMFIDHKTAFSQVERLIKTFYPEIVQLE